MAILSANFVDRSTKLAFSNESCVELSTSTTIRAFLRTQQPVLAGARFGTDFCWDRFHELASLLLLLLLLFIPASTCIGGINSMYD